MSIKTPIIKQKEDEINLHLKKFSLNAWTPDEFDAWVGKLIKDYYAYKVAKASIDATIGNNK